MPANLASLDQTIRYDLPLPRRIWASWDDHPETMAPESRLALRSPEFASPAAAAGTRAMLYLSASGPCQAELNGRAIAFAPSDEPSYWTVAKADVSGLLAASGTNRLTVRALAGSRTPFVLGCLDLEADGESALAPPRVAERLWVTDGSFEASLDGGASWQPAWAFEGVWDEPTGFANNGPDDWARLTHGRQRVGHRAFAGIVRSAPRLGEWTEADLAGEALEARVQTTRMHTPRIPWERLNPNMHHLQREDYARVANEWVEEQSGRGPEIYLDGGREVFGRLILRNTGQSWLQVAVVTGESVEEIEQYNRAMVGVYTLAAGERLTTFLIGFRYARIVALAAGDGRWRLAVPVIQALSYDCPRRGSFECSDGVLNRVWQVGADTVQLCAQNQIWDAPKRDLLPWMGDLHMESLIWLSVFGDGQLSRLSLQANRETGPALTRPFAQRLIPSLSVTWGGVDINGIPSYSAWWVISVRDYALLTGDLEYPRETLPELLSLMERLARGVAADGGWDWQAYGNEATFIDHSILSVEEETLGMQALASAALRAAGQILGWLDRAQEAEPWQALGDRMAARLAEQLAAAAPGSLHRQAASCALALGVVSPEQAGGLFPHIEAEDTNLRTPWWHGYELGAAMAAGRIDWLLAETRRYWGSMVSRGQTSLWECHDERWMTLPDPHHAAMTRENGSYSGHRISQCHGWAAGPTYYLTRAVLGVEPLAPGWKEVGFAPRLGDLEWAEGRIPTPHGEIHARVWMENGERKEAITAPAGVTVVRTGEPATTR